MTELTEVIAIGRELLYINTAIKESGTAYSNKFQREKLYESELFKELSRRREALRTRLLEIG